MSGFSGIKESRAVITSSVEALRRIASFYETAKCLPALCVSVLKSINIIVVLTATYTDNICMELFLRITFKLQNRFTFLLKL